MQISVAKSRREKVKKKTRWKEEREEKKKKDRHNHWWTIHLSNRVTEKEIDKSINALDADG